MKLSKKPTCACGSGKPASKCCEANLALTLQPQEPDRDNNLKFIPVLDECFDENFDEGLNEVLDEGLDIGLDEDFDEHLDNVIHYGDKNPNILINAVLQDDDEFYHDLTQWIPFEVLDEDVSMSLSSLFKTIDLEKPITDLLGLSFLQLDDFIHRPFYSGQWFSFSRTLQDEPTAPLLKLISMLMLAIDNNGLEVTGNGCFPDWLCRQVFTQYKSLKIFDDETQSRVVTCEKDFYELSKIRFVLISAGLLRLKHNRYYLTHKFKNAFHKNGYKSLYPIIFKHYCKEASWAYRQPDVDFESIQVLFLYSLFMLKQNSHKVCSLYEYQTMFLDAFPNILHEVSDQWLDKQTKTDLPAQEALFRKAYADRCQDEFLWLLGLADIEELKGIPVATNDGYQYKLLRIRKLPLLDKIYTFTLKNDDSFLHNGK